MKVITIGREYGAGGHSIGTRVAKELGIEFYDKDIIMATAKAGGITPESVMDGEEERSLLDSVIQAISPVSYVDKKDTVFEIESEVIKQLAAKGPCVILGRCAESILKDTPTETLSVFIYADEAHRMERAAEVLNERDPDKVRRALRKIDRARSSYCYYHTGHEWADCHNYDLALDSGTLGYDMCVKMICEAAR